MLRSCFSNLLATLFVVILPVTSTLAATDGDVWPRSFVSEGTQITIHEPLIDSWDGFNLKAHSAVAVKPGKQEPVYGVVGFSGLTLVDKAERMVKIEELRVDTANFPSFAEQPPGFLPIVTRAMEKRASKIGLDRLEAVMALGDDLTEINPVPVKNPVPRIIFAEKPSVLVYIDGEPKYAPLKDSDDSLWRVVNTRVLLLRDGTGKHYLHIYNGFMETPGLAGPWTVLAKPSSQLKKAAAAARKDGKTDLLEGEGSDNSADLPSLAAISPDIYIATAPTELFVTEGEANFAPIEGTQLLYVTNSSGSIFKHLQDNRNYVLISGRWFRAGSLNGPWEFVPAKNLPPDFAQIPDESPKENVKASVPGTSQAKEALIANRIPQTAKVSRDDARFIPLEFDGEPQLAPIEGTTLDYVINCATPVIRVDDQTWYALQNGVWYIAFSLDGPWRLADTIHAAIYSIPPSSPLHYVTYVKVYRATPQYVYVGYTPGYFGTVVSDNVIVYGTGYYYNPWIGSYWYGPPLTYGLGCNIAWTPWTGWGFSFGFGIGWGWGSGWYYPPSPWWGPYYYGSRYYGHRHAWGPGGWAYTTGNYYRRGSYSSANYPRYRSRNIYGNAYNSRRGTVAAGQPRSAQNIYRSDAARSATAPAVSRKTRQGETLFGTREGKVYRPTRQGTWEAVNPPARKSTGIQAPARDFSRQAPARDFSREQRARQTGEQRYRSFQGIPRPERSQTAPSGWSSGRQFNLPAGGQGTVKGGGYSRGGHSSPPGGYSRGGGAPSGSAPQRGSGRR